MISSYFLKYLGDKYGVYGSIFIEKIRSSKNNLKNIAIGPESLISELGIIKTL